MMYRLNRSELLFTVGVIFQETTGFLEHKQYHKFRSAVSWPPGGNDTVRLRIIVLIYLFTQARRAYTM